MVSKDSKDWQLKKSVNNCTLEDFQGTYKYLQLIGPEEIRRRLETLTKLKKVIKDIKEGMGSDGVCDKTNKQRKVSKSEHEGKDYLVLPKLCPEVYQRSRLTGYTDVTEHTALGTSEGVQMSLCLEDENKKLRRRKKRTRRKDSSICLNCQMTALNEKSWLPQLADGARRERRNSKKEDPFVLPEIRVCKNR